MQSIRLMLYSILVVIIFPVGIACSPAGPDSWFVYYLEFNVETIPEGIHIIETGREYFPYAVRNEYEEPFYFGDGSWSYRGKYPEEEFPYEYTPRFKLFSNQVYYFSDMNEERIHRWSPNYGGFSIATKADIETEYLYVEGGFQEIRRDDRPKNVSVPPPQSFSLEAFHKGKLINITGKIIYELNEDYDPKRFEKGARSCGMVSGGGILIVLAVLVLAGTFLLGMFIINKLK